MPQGDPRPGEKYLHFKNKLYQIIAIAQHSETGEKLVIYQALYGTFQIYARPFSMFVSPVDKEKYPQIKQKYRFQWVEFKKTGQESVKTETAKTKMSGAEASPRGTGEKTPGLESAGQKDGQIEAAARKEPAKEDLKEAVPVSRMSAEQKMMAFFDADTVEDKYKILLEMRDEITDRMINNMAVVLDVVIEEGPLDLRYEELKACLRTMQRYECNRLRMN